jgi:hypothetical protein
MRRPPRPPCSARPVPLPATATSEDRESNDPSLGAVRVRPAVVLAPGTDQSAHTTSNNANMHTAWRLLKDQQPLPAFSYGITPRSPCANRTWPCCLSRARTNQSHAQRPLQGISCAARRAHGMRAVLAKGNTRKVAPLEVRARAIAPARVSPTVVARSARPRSELWWRDLGRRLTEPPPPLTLVTQAALRTGCPRAHGGCTGAGKGCPTSPGTTTGSPPTGPPGTKSGSKAASWETPAQKVCFFARLLTTYEVKLKLEHFIVRSVAPVPGHAQSRAEVDCESVQPSSFEERFSYATSHEWQFPDAAAAIPT